MRTIAFLLVFSVVLFNDPSAVNGQNVRPGGLNVCSRRYTYNTYYTAPAQRVAYHNYRTCCKKVWGACLRRCTRYRTSIVTYYVSRLKVNQGTSYYCCPGWARRGSECPVAICRPACQNGYCLKPNKCHCRKGFSGAYCQNDINECQKQPCQQVCTNLRGSFACSCRRGYRKLNSSPQDGKCQNVNECASNARLCVCAKGNSCKAQCIDTIGSYRCQCSSGYQLASNSICKDIDECKTGQHRCQHRCLNSLGGYRCACNPGYWLKGDKRSCHDINECRRANGGCEQICSNIVGSYRCSCRSGFILGYDRAKCVDVNECVTLKPCDRLNGVCQNTRGSYRCSCKAGYQLTNGNKCQDVNECKGANQCEQECQNSVGSYFCKCRDGYVLAADGRKCNDLDECKQGLHDCDHTCINTVGSYKCQCRPGFQLMEDKLSCKAIPCKKLYNPRYGRVQCTGLNYRQKCTYTCQAGYRLVGNKERICQLSARWSGAAARCYPDKCPTIRPPLHGYLELPCVEQYNSTCTVKCNKGFNLKGNSLVKCGLINNKVMWINNNATCEEIKSCTPNPCKNGGICRSTLKSGYKCDCTGTNFEGANCEIGTIRMASYPALIYGKTTDWIKVDGQPNFDLTILPQPIAGDIEFIPTKIKISHPLTSTRFKVKPKSSGLIRIKYALTGKSAKEFKGIPDTIAFVAPLDASEKVTQIPNEGYIKNQCHKLQLDRCLNGKKVELLSSCPWSTDGTLGYQSIAAGNIKIPLSLAGVTLPEQGLNVWMYRKKGILSVSKETVNVLKDGMSFCLKKDACEDASVTNAEHRFIVQQNLFARSHLDALSKIVPQWISVNLQHGYSGFHLSNIQALVLKSYQMQSLKVCQNFPKSFDSGVFAVQILNLPLTFRSLSMKFSSQSTYPTCVATDMCKMLTYVSLPKESSINLTPEMKKLGVRHMDLSVHGIGFAGNSFAPVCFEGPNEKNQCLSGNVWMKVSGGISVSRVNVSVDGDVYVAPADLEKAALMRFDSPIRYVYQGSIIASITTQAGGKAITFNVEDTAATGFGSFGPINANSTEYGLTIHTKTSVQIRHMTSLVSFHPDQLAKKFKSQILYQLQGGKVNGVDNRAKLQLLIRRLTISLPRVVQGLLRSLKGRQTVYEAEYKALNQFSRTSTSLFNALKAKMKRAEWEYQETVDTLSSLMQLARSGSDIAALLSDRAPVLERSLARKRFILNQVKFFKRSLNGVDSLTAIPKTTKVIDQFRGVKIEYVGKLCFQALCFENLNVSIDDHSHEQPDMISIQAKFRSNQTIAGQFQVAKGASLKGLVSKNRDYFTVNLDVVVKLFGKEVFTRLEVDPSKVGFTVKNFLFSANAEFDISVSAKNSKSTNWENMFFKISGTALGGSPVSTLLESHIKNYIEITSRLIKDRHKDAADKLKLVNQEMTSIRSNVEKKKAAFKKAESIYIKQKAEYQTWLIDLNKAVETFNSYRVSDFFKNIEKDLNSLFPFKKCSDVCISVPVYCVCQEPVMVDANTLECKLKNEKAITTVEEPYNTECPLTEYRFVPIYTGTCRKGSRRSLSGALAGIGAGIGTIFGGPIGGAIGGVIGGFVGSLFGSSCSETYRVHKEVIHRQVDCTLSTFKPRTKTWKEAACYNKIKTVLSGYGNPTECGCANNNNTCVVAEDPACLAANIRNITKRRNYVKNRMESAGVYNNSFEKLLEAKTNTARSFKILIQGEKKYLFAKRDYEKAEALLKQLTLEITFTNRSLSNFDENFALEKCFSRVSFKSQYGPLKVKKIEFEASTTVREQLLCKVTAERTDIGHANERTFLLDLRDFNVSIINGAKLIAKETFCKHRIRGRRSTDSVQRSADAEDLFVQGDSQIPENATVAEKACLVSNTIFTFLKTASTEIRGKLKNLGRKRKEIGASLNLVNGKISKQAGDEVKDQNDLLQSLRKQMSEDVKELSGAKLLKEWIDDMEVVTGAYNLTKCLTFKDCVLESLRQLKGLPSMVTIDHEEYLSSITDAEDAFLKLFSATSDQSVSKAALKFKRTIKKIIRASAFCSQTPQVQLDTPPKLEVNANEKLQIKCNVIAAKLALKYSWRFNGVLLLSEDKSILDLYASPNKQGSYQCVASNIVGTNVSQETFVVVRQKPKFTAEPVDFLFYTSMPKEIVPYFTCNVTSDPLAKISWFFQSFKSKSAQNLAFSRPVLRIPQPRKRNAGFYHCTAENSLGKITSKKARLDFVRSRLPNQAVTISYDQRVGRSGVPDRALLAKTFATAGNFTDSQSVNVSYEFKSASQLNMVVNVVENLDQETGLSASSEIEMLRRVSRSRIDLSGKIEKLVEGLKTSRGRSGGQKLAKSLRVGFNGEVCPPGYVLHENGFTCLQCVVGTYEESGKCHNCSIGTYQEKPGKTRCNACSSNLVTQTVGSVNSYQCRVPELRHSDILFLLDMSSSVGRDNWDKVKLFVKRFADEFVTRDSDLRVGVITFGTTARLRIPLKRFHKSQLKQRVEYLSYYGGQTMTFLALAKANREFRRNFVPGRKRIIFVMTDGKSSSSRYTSGFSLVRRAAQPLLRNGIHIVAIGVGSNINPAELKAMASYPKDENFIVYKGFDQLITAARKISAQSLKGSCRLLQKDIGIVIEASGDVPDRKLEETKTFLRAMLTKLASPMHKISVSTFGKNLANIGKYKEIKSSFDVDTIMRSIVQRKLEKTGAYQSIVQKLFNDVVTEKYEAVSPTKVIIFVTKTKFDRKILNQVLRLYSEDVAFLTVTMENDFSDTDSLSIGFGDETSFKLSQLPHIINTINSIDSSNQYCKADPHIREDVTKRS